MAGCMRIKREQKVVLSNENTQVREVYPYGLAEMTHNEAYVCTQFAHMSPTPVRLSGDRGLGTNRPLCRKPISTHS